VRGYQGIIVLAGLLTAWTSFAQTRDSLSTRYSQELDTRVLRVLALFNHSEAPWRARASTSSEVTNRNLPGFESQWKNEVFLRLNAERRITSRLALLLESSGQDYRDRAARLIVERGNGLLLPDRTALSDVAPSLISGQDTRIGRASTRGGLRWRPDATLELHLLGGAAFDHQLQGAGSGASARGGFDWQPTWQTPFELEGDGWLDQYGPRSNHEASLKTAAQQTFGDAMDYLSASWLNRRNDLFLGTSGNVVSRVNDEIRIDNSLVTPIATSMVGTYDIQYRRSSVNYEHGDIGQGRELDFQHRFSLRGSRGPYIGDIGYSFGVEDRQYGASLILGRRQVINLSGAWSQQGDTVYVSYNAQKLRFDSPDTLEMSDRDRLIHGIRVGSGFWIQDNTRLTFEALILLDHLVNLNSVRSADNRWNRVFRLSPGVEWIPASGWRNQTRFELLANYNVYDFEDLAAATSFRSNALRRWSASDTLRVPLGKSWATEWATRYDLEDRGRLRWKEFTQELSEEAKAWFGTITLEKAVWARFTLIGGYKWHERMEDQLDRNADGQTIRTPARTYRAYGPLFRVVSRRWTRILLSLDATLLTVDDSARPAKEKRNSVFLTFLYRW